MMRSHFSIALTLAVLVAACTTDETVQRPPPPPVNWSAQARSSADAGPVKATAKERAVAGAYTKALGSQGFAQLVALLDDDAHSEFAGAKDAHGRDNVVKAHDAMFGAFDQRVFTPSRTWLTDSAQVVECTMTGVQARDWEGVVATHKPVSFKGVSLLWTNDDGSIIDVYVLFDEAVVKVQLGAGPKDLANLQPAAAATAGDVVEQARTSEEAANVLQVRASLTALEKGDEAGYLATMSDDVEVNVPERAQPARGKDEARAYFKTLRKEISEIDTSVDNAWGVKQFVIAEYFIVGEQQLPIGWVPVQSEKLIKLAVIDVVEMRGGKIARVWRYDDPAQILATP